MHANMHADTSNLHADTSNMHADTNNMHATFRKGEIVNAVTL